MANKYSEKVVEGRSFSFRLVIISASVLAIFINRLGLRVYREMHDGKNFLERFSPRTRLLPR
jgi:hypothetical protein